MFENSETIMMTLAFLHTHQWPSDRDAGHCKRHEDLKSWNEGNYWVSQDNEYC